MRARVQSMRVAFARASGKVSIFGGPRPSGVFVAQALVVLEGFFDEFAGFSGPG